LKRNFHDKSFFYGGRVVATGTPAEVAASGESRTAPYLAARL